MKYSKKYIIYSFFASLPTVIFVVLLAMMIFTTSEEDSEEILFTGVFGVNDFTTLGIIIGVASAVYILALLALCVLWWSKISYTVDNDNITLKSGVLFRKNIVLPYDKVQAITVDRPLFLRFFGLSKLAIDSGNTAKVNNEIVIIDDESKVKELEKELHSRLRGEVVSTPTPLDNSTPSIYSMDAKLAAKYVLNNVWLYIVLIASLIIASFITVTADDPLAAISFAVLPVGSFILFAIIAILSLTITYHDYQIVKKGKEVVVSFGLFSKKRMVINRAKIKAAVVKQDVVQLKTGYASINLEVIGLKATDDQSEIKVNNIVPFVKIADVQAILDVFSTDLTLQPVENTAKKGSLVFFLLLPLLITSMIGLPFVIGYLVSGTFAEAIAIILTCIYAIAMIIVTICGIFTRYHQGVAYDDKNLYLTNGALIKNHYVVPWTSVISVGSTTTPLRQKYDVQSLVVSTYNNKLEAQKTVAMLDTKIVKDTVDAFEKYSN